MIKYDWRTVYSYAAGKPSKILDIIYYLSFPKEPLLDNSIYSGIDWDGSSFLIHPEPIFDVRYHKNESMLAEYVALASFRNLAEFRVTKRRTLPLMESPMSAGKLITNDYLSIYNEEIHFCWEEAKH